LDERLNDKETPMPWIKNWFSNMLPLDTPFEYQGILFSTVENFYVAMKTQKHEVELRKQIAAMPPHVAKRFGRQLQRRPDWEGIKLPVMEFALRIKFAPGTSWYKKLIATGDTEIVEYNNWGDKFWGVIAYYNGRTITPSNPRIGQNHLGKLLMKIRAESR
jgi:hypothetical protein